MSTLLTPDPFTMGAHNPKTGDTLYITDCKLCPTGVYKGQPKTWLNGLNGPAGWSHTECAYRAGSLAHLVGARVMVVGSGPATPGEVVEIVYVHGGRVWEYDIRLNNGRLIARQPRHVRAAVNG